MDLKSTPLSKQLAAGIQHKIDHKTKPIGALGQLEAIALQIGLIQQTDTPSIKMPHIIVFAGDHGIAKEGKVNPYPQEVTAQMVLNFLNGGAAINSFCKRNDVALTVVDAGVNHNFKGVVGLVDAKIAYGTKNYANEPAMTAEQCSLAMKKGGGLVHEIQQKGCNTIGFGEMGIGNTSAASLLMQCYTAIPLEECVGAGTGLQKEGITLKKEILAAAQRQHDPISPLEVLATYGGFEIAMMAGAILKAAALKMVVMIDGFIVTAALLAAHALDKNCLDYCIFAHTSGEQGHQKMLDFLNQKPLLNLGLRLGEGTGAALAVPLLRAAVGFLSDMASFDEAEVSKA
ncbi:nicotinate-nucleotide--dimethylbenzimidazole phosphoribosyltransferase [Spongiimicrobium salis]|uniref:nicotinate-nucleotide--dimethylbenzimidazole phosphoribosyltransferase n=1 Tax=Spongiimicrobium salis TaxID=1667022 RepID=UPI00374C9AB1